MKLNEVLDDHRLITNQEVTRFCSLYGIHRYALDENDQWAITVNQKNCYLSTMAASIQSKYSLVPHLPVKFKQAHDFEVRIEYASPVRLISFQGFPRTIRGDLMLAGPHIPSLHDIHKHIKHIDKRIHFLHARDVTNLLGLLLIDGLQAIAVGGATDISHRMVDALYIINGYLTHKEKNRDINACQEELIENGLEKYARL